MQHTNYQWKDFFSIMWLKLFTLLVALQQTADAAKILGVFPHASESHFVVMRTFMMELARREHNVTIYSSHRLDDRLDSLKEFIVEPEFPFWKEVQNQAGCKDLVELNQLPDGKLSKSLAQAGLSLMNYFMDNFQMQQLLKVPPEEFDYDLIIVDMFYTESLLALGYHFRRPVIGIVSTDFAQYMQRVQENLVPSACLPYDVSNYDANMGYWERLDSIKQCLSRRKDFVHHHYGNQEQVIAKYFNSMQGPLPSIMELQSNLALLLVNNYYPLARARPLNPNMIPVGGIQIRAARELPWHVRRFLDEAHSGAIYMHLGDEQLCADIPLEKREVLFRVFSQRQERIIWTCHDVQKLEGQPANVMIQHMVPQTDILAHPRVQLFIMNGDLMGVQEAIVRHVPVIGIPLFKNEQDNVALAVKLQIALRIDYANLTETSLNWALDAMLRKEFYILNIRDVSKAFRDRPLGGLATALFWLDYVIRYGSQPLKSWNSDIPLGELHLNDLFIYYALLVFALVGCLVGLYFVGMHLWKRRETAKMLTKLN